VTAEQSHPDAPRDPEAVSPELAGIDRRHLRRLGHALEPVVQVGAAGITPGVIAAVDRALSDHELVKLRIAHERPERREIAESLARETRSAVAGLVGHAALLYRAAREPERRRIELPSARRGRN
jgi:RNA-binding protein